MQRTTPIRIFLAALALTLAGCAYAPNGTIEQPPRLFTYEESMHAIDTVFGPYGLAGKARSVAWCESRDRHAYAISPNGYYKGLFQLGAHFEGRLNQAAADLHRFPTWYDPLIQSHVVLRQVLADGGWRQWSCG